MKPRVGDLVRLRQEWIYYWGVNRTHNRHRKVFREEIGLFVESEEEVSHVLFGCDILAVHPGVIEVVK